MKKILIYFISFLVIYFISINIVIAIDVTDFSKIGGSSPDTGCPGAACWSTFRELVGANRTTSSFQAIRITFYNVNGSKVSNSIDFANSSYNLLDSKNFFRVENKKSKIDYIKENDNGNFVFNLGTGADINYLIFPDYLGTQTSLVNVSQMLIKYMNTNINLLSQANFEFCKAGKYNCTDTNINNYYIAIEPATVVRLDGNSYYGTYYELKWLYLQKFNASKYNYAKTVVTKYLPNSITVFNANDDRIKTFCSNANNLDCSDSKLDGLNDNNDKFGLGLLRAAGLIEKIPVQYQSKTCTANINYNSCSKISIYSSDDSNNSTCILNNPAYKLEFTENTSCRVYCAFNITTDFEGFYNSFKFDNELNAVKSGAYFKLDSPSINVRSNCYSDGQCAPNWSDNVKNYLNTSGSKSSTEVMLSLSSNNNYSLNMAVTTEGITNGNNATFETKYSYSLNPLTNRFISIKTMAQDKDTISNNLSEMDYKNLIYKYTEGDKSKTVIDNKGPMLTTPMNYPTGNYKYSLDLSNTILKDYLNGVFANKVSSNSEYRTGKYDIRNEVKSNISNNIDFNKFSCNYTVKNDSFNCDPTVEVCSPPPQVCTENCDPTPCDPTLESCGGIGVEGINVIYRPIALDMPFPGQKGEGRTPGFNWQGVDANGISDIYKYITNNRGVTGNAVYQKEPLYVIKLDASTINMIREYNKTTNYDYNDFNLECTSGKGTECKSKFLRDNNLISSGTCKSINSIEDFYKCADK